MSLEETLTSEYTGLPNKARLLACFLCALQILLSTYRINTGDFSTRIS